MKLTSALCVSHARAIPSAPPASATIRLSVTTCRSSVPRPAPNAARTAYSRRRYAMRASARFATFAQAMASTSSVVPDKASSMGREALTSVSSS